MKVVIDTNVVVSDKGFSAAKTSSARPSFRFRSSWHLYGTFIDSLSLSLLP